MTSNSPISNYGSFFNSTKSVDLQDLVSLCRPRKMQPQKKTSRTRVSRQLTTGQRRATSGFGKFYSTVGM